MRPVAERRPAVRQRTLDLAAPLSAEDMQPQAMPDASPTKWHLAHTTWFFDEFILRPHGYAPEAPENARFLFNSYYEAVGERHPRPDRGLVTRPGVQAIIDWRLRVDDALARMFAEAPANLIDERAPLLELGLNHEEQHQELLLMDILSLFALHPGAPAYRIDLKSAWSRSGQGRAVSPSIASVRARGSGWSPLRSPTGW
jgi:hypothetical protein